MEEFLGFKISELEKLGGLNTAREIDGQPELWKKIFALIKDKRKEISAYLRAVYSNQGLEVILTGAGSSAFIGEVLEGPFQRYTKARSRAVATTNLVTHPENYLNKDRPTLMISFARSGNSPESVATIKLANEICQGVFHLIITCNESGDIVGEVRPGKDMIIVLPAESNDKGLAMTGSYTSMLLAAYLISRLDDIDILKSQIDLLASYGEKILNDYRDRIFSIAQLEFSRAIFLGSGPMLGTARESHLKLQELTDGRIICKHDSYLGFRHGPKAVIDRSTLIFFLFSDDEYVRQYEFDLVEDIDNGERGLYRVALVDRTEQLNGFDTVIELAGPEDGRISEDLLSVVSVLPAQLLGFFKSISLGLNPDSPSVSGAISRVVEGVKLYQYRGNTKSYIQ